MDHIFEHNPNLNSYHRTSDGQGFYTAEDARLHAKTLTDKTVKLVERGNETEEKPMQQAADKIDYREAINGIKAAATLEELKAFEGDTRKSVMAAYDARLAELSAAQEPAAPTQTQEPANTNEQNPE